MGRQYIEWRVVAVAVEVPRVLAMEEEAMVLEVAVMGVVAKVPAALAAAALVVVAKAWEGGATVAGATEMVARVVVEQAAAVTA